MNILGLNASPWLSVGHDASAAIIVDGEIKFAIEEERLTRKKRAYDALPILSAKACLDHCGLGLRDIDYIVFGWDFEKVGIGNVNYKARKEDIAKRFFPKKYFDYDKLPPIVNVEHHLAHAASTYRCSGFNESAIIVLDGQGEYCSTSIWHGKGGEIKKVWSNKIEDSLGYMYSSVARFIGMRNGDEGKLMGLASYGRKDQKVVNALEKSRINLRKGDLERNSGQQKTIVTQWLKNLENGVRPIDNTKTSFNKISSYFSKGVKFDQLDKNIAFSVQYVLEGKILDLVEKAMLLTGSKNICLSGGVSLNCISNQKVLENMDVNLYAFSAANDAGCAIGAALHIYSNKNKKFMLPKVRHSYFGPSFSDSEIEKELKKFKIKYKKVKDISRLSADLISKNKVVGWFQGRMEMGPRALGNRSILANPSDKKMLENVNKIKERESWRPFAPSVLYENRNDFFELNNDFEFMIVGSNVHKNKKNLIPAVVHADNTSRPHAVKKETNEKYYNLINCFYEKTGLPMVMNTSFNGAGEPIVCTPRDAVKTFFSSGLDYLAIGNFLVSK